MTSSPATAAPPLNKFNLSVLVATPAITAIAVPLYGYFFGFHAFEWIAFAVFMALTGLGITAGYHRLWSHKAYEAHSSVRLFLAFWGACAGQNTILNWCSDHRRHHKYTDDTEDPYDSTKGFWYSHVGWIVEGGREEDLSNVDDLKKEKVVMWQYNNYLAITLFSNVALPLILGAVNFYALGGNFWGTLVLAGFLRFVLNHHFTFLINSACHMFGKQTFSAKSSARDSMILALFTYGEGYHNFHHTFQADYRNGVDWWHFDPTKWLIWSLSTVKLTSKLKRIPAERILKKKMIAKVQVHFDEICRKRDLSRNPGHLEQLKAKFDCYSNQLDEWEKKCQQRVRALKQSQQQLSEELKSKATDSWNSAKEAKEEFIEFIHQLNRELPPLPA